MRSVLIDNWTLHDITYLPNKNDLENLLMAILLWDEIYFWDNGRTTWWKEEPDMANKLPPLTGLVVPPNVELEVNSIRNADTVVSGAQQYLLIAERCGLDYLPKQERYQYLTSKEHVIWQKLFIEKMEKDIQEYYNDLMKMVGNIQLRFQFPLLVDYIRSQAGDSDYTDYIAVALHLRQTGPLYNMRSWIENLHNYIDAGNWSEVKYYIKSVEDIVPTIHSPLIKDVQCQVAIPPTVGVSFRPNWLGGRHKTQLTFLRDLAKFAIEKRPES